MRPKLMRIRLGRTAAVPLAAVLLLTAASIQAEAQDFAKYHNYADMTVLLQTLTAGHKDLARLASIGKTVGGRDIWAVELANPAGVPVKDRPGLLVAATFEGDHIVGSEIALVMIDTLL